MSPPGRRYIAYGLRIRSEIALPLTAASIGREADVNIRIGAVPEALAAPRRGRGPWEAAPGLFLMTVEGVARYLVREGREILVDPAGPVVGEVISTLLGAVLAALLQQRGILTLHASAIASGDGAVLFAGHSGLGKSTLLAALIDRGSEMLSDDVTGIVAEGGDSPVALPAFPCLRLWRDAVQELRWEARMQGPVREGMDKHFAAVERFREAPLPVRLVFVLKNGQREGIEMETMSPGAALERLARRTYRRRFALGLGRGGEQFRTLAALVRCVPVVRVAKPSGGGLTPEELANRVEACMREGAPLRARTWPARSGSEAGAALRRKAVSRQAHGPRRFLDQAGGEAPAGSIVWLASYPRSGNTWLRALLTNYFFEGNEAPACIDKLVGSPFPIRREVFDEELGVSSSDLTVEEILHHRTRLHELLAAKLPSPSFVKVHDAYLRTAGGLLFPPAVTLGAVYIIRNPLDVAVSCAHFWNWPVARAVAELNSPAAALSMPAGGIHEVLPQPLLTWSGHVASWLDQREFPLHVVRYEDLLADAEAAFGAVLRFAGLEPEAEPLARAVEYARFDRLRSQEERSGFGEKPWTARRFFRVGRQGSWREALSRDQVRAITEAHAPVMERLGYLREAEAFLAGQDAAP